MAIYKTAPTFEMDKESFESYRDHVMTNIKNDRMNLMANGKVLLWIDEELAKFPEEKEKKEKKQKV